MLEVRRLEVLSHLAERGSFSAAADALGMTQSAVSQQIAALEREIGLPVVRRRTRPVELTEAGSTLTRHAAWPRSRPQRSPDSGVRTRTSG